MAGEGYTHFEIVRWMNRMHGGKDKKDQFHGRTVQAILSRPEAHRFVGKFRQEFLKDVKEIAIADKRIRLYDLEALRQRLSTLIINIKIERAGSEEKFFRFSKRLMEVLDMAREEMEN